MGHSAAHWDNRAPFHLTKDVNGIEQVVLWNPRGASARISLQGGRVFSWRNHRGEELLFNSSKTNFKVPKTVRGGISACFPQFGNCDALEKHGFARKRMWKIDENPPPMRVNDSRGKSYVDLLLEPAEEDLKYWPHRNLNGKPFNFSFAYHTYLSVSDISEVRIEGLETLDYLDNLCQRERFTEQGDAITFESEVDRVYLSSAPCVAVLDHEKKRTYVLRKEGLPDVALWNPWDKKSKAMADFGDSDYRQMLCVDGAAIETGVTLKPGEEWTGQVELAAIPSSFCTDNIHPRLRIF
ncbi:putative glucose-6-phosphate 1-epimerase isoform X2 [Henckelia pumila]|uniref:putative glucose-6-phosphate 1-epimerase isoform X2 n=1 Tax=Henckelia pumila TaxID=405737 RepID=UPI003C6DF666